MKLTEIFPAENYSEKEHDRIVYSRDGSEFEGACTAVVWPTTREQITSMVSFAKKDNKFTIRGAGTNTLGACVPAKSVVVDMSKMNHIIEWGFDYVVVEAGVILQELLKECKKRSVIFPIKPVEYPVCTVGGMIAMNTQGLDAYYGKTGDYVLELEVVDGDGKKLKVSGSELKYFIGMEGITGIIVTAKLKLLTEPKKKTVSIFKFNTIKAMADKALILDKFKNVMEIECYDELCSSIMGLDGVYHLIVGYSNEAGLIRDEEEIAKLDEMKEKLQHILINKKYTIREDPDVPFDYIPKFLHWLQKEGVPCFGHMKSRVFHPCFREGTSRNEEMYLLIKSMNGKVAGEFGIGMKRKRFLTREETGKYTIVKKRYDPDKIFNRGVIID
jgi:glycolate oxidase